ncbi:uncharacterized protein LOC135815715 [Sycon ciliatum]|uniref:uncharacterized protein LOC135815715 n=1 Tax=Sycon ciliatum TaxID=27933 RepID=UPI0031F69C0C|eukprot:scpid43472/ scgid14882/ 
MPKFPASQPRQRNVEVVKFCSQAPKRYSRPPRPREDVSKPESDLDISSMHQDISSFVSANLQGRDRSKFDKGRLRHLGAAEAKPQKMPFKMAVGIKRAREARQRKEEEMARLAGNKQVQAKSKRRRLKEESRGRKKQHAKKTPRRST